MGDRLHRWRGHRVISFVSAVVLVIVTGGTALAHAPISGQKAYADYLDLPYRFATGTPTWVSSTVRTVFETDYPDANYNNTRMPQFVYSTSAAAHVWFVADSTSPCSGSDTWLMCADNDWDGDGNRAEQDWRIYVRDVENAPVYFSGTRAAWLQQTGACPSGRLCFDARRAFIHEILHVTLSAPHNEQGQAYSVMSAATPNSPKSGWNIHHIQPCDEAAAQLLYDLSYTGGQYSDCFDHLANAVSQGLDSNLTVGASGYGDCLGTGVTASGRLEITNYSSYKLLAANPLTNRSISIDRRLKGSTTWTTITTAVASSASGNNWSKVFSSTSAGTWEYRARYLGESGVGPATSAIFTITWTKAC